MLYIDFTVMKQKALLTNAGNQVGVGDEGVRLVLRRHQKSTFIPVNRLAPSHT